MKIVVLDGHVENPGDLSWEGFEALGELTVYDRTPYTQGREEIIRRAKGAQVVLLNKTVMDAETIKALAPELRYIGVLATGYNVVDVQAAKELGIAVTNIPSYGTAAVAQHTMALLLEVCNHVGSHNRAVKDGEWTRCPDFSFWNAPLTELEGKTFGIIGYGRIGRATARLASAFGMKVLVSGRRPIEEPGVCSVSLDTLLRESDVISLHCPLFPETERMINRQTIACMKDGVIILNTSRGQLIDEQALAEALHSGKVSAAGIDVLSAEPAKADNPLLTEERCIITPHIAWAPRESRQRLMNTAVENLRSFLAEKPQNVVNP